MSDDVEELKAGLSEAIKSICLTRDYVGEKLLPPIDGWSWYDAGKLISKLIPDDEWVEQFNLRVEQYDDDEDIDETI